VQGLHIEKQTVNKRGQPVLAFIQVRNKFHKLILCGKGIRFDIGNACRLL
jgi:hypothetical protein